MSATSSEPTATTAPSSDNAPSTRRSLLTSAAAAAAGAVAASLASATPALGADGDPLLLGSSNEAASLTTLDTTAVLDSKTWFLLKAATGEALRVQLDTGTAARMDVNSGIGTWSTSSTGPAVKAVSTSWIGVEAMGGQYGVKGTYSAPHMNLGAGVMGDGLDTGTGVAGTTSDASSFGVAGSNTSDFAGGVGVVGTSKNGVGVTGSSTNDTGVSGIGFQVGVLGHSDEPDGVGVRGEAPAASLTAYGVYGLAGKGVGVRGEATEPGSVGVGGISTGGSAGSYGVVGVATDLGVGVWGKAVNGKGVYGSVGTGIAVHGVADGAGGTAVHGAATDATGVGVKATAATGTALKVEGKASFTRSGVATIAAGKSSVVVTVAGNVAASSLCFANLTLLRSGVYVAAVRPNFPTGKLTIYLNKAVTASTKVAWFVLG